MPVRIVQSKQNARLKELRRALARPGREGHGMAGIEGPKLLEEALHAGLRIECVFAAQSAERQLEPLPLPRETQVLLMPKALLDSALTTEAPQSIAALVEPPDWTWAHLLDSPRKGVPLIVVLAGLQDPGNLGTILRSAEAFGASGVVALPGSVSAWNPKSVRASAGSIFRVPFLSVSVLDCITNLREAGVKIWTTTVHEAEPADLLDLTLPVALIFGNEGSGVPAEIAEHADGAVTIPCPGAVESLNAAVAASILLYEAARQRGIGGMTHLDLRGGKR
ncbi:MAG: TrmH family RNA methyltransferase [Acidobacteriota bacterium]